LSSSYRQLALPIRGKSNKGAKKAVKHLIGASDMQENNKGAEKAVKHRT
jgi:hypothetical protein